MDATSDLRERIIASLRDTMWLRCRLIRTGSMDNITDLERVFTAHADAGNWNRQHPRDPIRILDLIQVEPSIASLTV